MDVMYKYFMASGNDANEICNYILNDKQETKEKQINLLIDYNADSLLMRDGKWPIGLGFNHKLKAKDFLIFFKKIDNIYYYIPDRNFVKGNDIALEMDEAAETDWSDYICCNLNVYIRFADQENQYHISEAEMTPNGRILIKLPYNDKNKLPEIPQNLLPIEKYEYDEMISTGKLNKENDNPYNIKKPNKKHNLISWLFNLDA